MDLTASLPSLDFQHGLSEQEEELVLLRSSAAGLTVCGCGHAAFCCRLAASVRNKLNLIANKSSHPEGLNIGIVGGGRVGKQLAQTLLSVPSIKPSNISISTRRPETLKFSKKGIECYFDNRRLASGADVLFLCVLPSHLVQLCAEIRSHLSAHCLVYSFTSAVPLPRLAQLLGHSSILKPQYNFMSGKSAQLWLRQKKIADCLKDEEILTASCPLSMTGELILRQSQKHLVKMHLKLHKQGQHLPADKAGSISLDRRWMSAVLYSLLNMCTAEGLKSEQTIQLLNEALQTKLSTGTFTVHSFVSSSCASTLSNPEKPFPWISLTDTQTKETPMSSYVSGCKALQDLICAMYHNTFCNFSMKQL